MRYGLVELLACPELSFMPPLRLVSIALGLLELVLGVALLLGLALLELLPALGVEVLVDGFDEDELLEGLLLGELLDAPPDTSPDDDDEAPDGLDELAPEDMEPDGLDAPDDIPVVSAWWPDLRPVCRVPPVRFTSDPIVDRPEALVLPTCVWLFEDAPVAAPLVLPDAPAAAPAVVSVVPALVPAGAAGATPPAAVSAIGRFALLSLPLLHAVTMASAATAAAASKARCRLMASSTLLVGCASEEVVRGKERTRRAGTRRVRGVLLFSFMSANRLHVYPLVHAARGRGDGNARYEMQGRHPAP